MRVERSWLGVFHSSGVLFPHSRGGGCGYIFVFFTRARVISPPARGGRFSFGGYLVLYGDTGQGKAQGLDSLAEFPLAHSLPRHMVSMNTSTDSPKKKRYTELCFRCMTFLGIASAIGLNNGTS